MTKIRGFELLSTYNNQDLLPKRETAHAAGYDLKVAENTVIAPGEIVLVPTGVKASVLAAIKENYQVSVGLSAVGVANQRKFQKTLHKWHSAGVSVEGELS